jgi:hypothetical protein
MASLRYRPTWTFTEIIMLKEWLYIVSYVVNDTLPHFLLFSDKLDRVHILLNRLFTLI